MVDRVIPSSSVEFQTLTTEPAWGTDEVDYQPYDIKKQEDGSEEKVNRYWKVLDYWTRDWRLGFLSTKTHDINFIWSYAANAGQILLLRNGSFERSFISMLLPVVSMMETSQSLNGFFRRNFQTVKQEQEYKDNTPTSGGLKGLFK